MVSIATAGALPGADRAAAQQPAPLRISVEEAMALATRNSLAVVAARATRERASADVTAARSGYFPQINLSGSYIHMLRSEYDDLFAAPGMDATGQSMAPVGELGELPFAAVHSWRAGVDVSQSIWDGNRTSSSVAAARGAERSAALDERARRAQAVLEATDAYFGAELAAEVARIADASLALAEQTLAQTRLGLSQGTAPEFDVVRAEVTRDNQRTQLLRARAARDVALVRLHRVLGVPFDRPIELTTRLGGGDLSEPARRTAGVSPGGERVNVAQARAAAEIRRAQIGIARADRWPRLALFTSYGVVDYPEEFWPDRDWRANWTVGAQVSVPLFSGFRTTAAIAGARADLRAAEALAADAVLRAAVDQRERESDVAVSAAAFASSHRSSELARRAHGIAEVRYRQGVSTYLELVDARIALDQAQINEATAARDLQVAQVRLALLPALPLAPSIAPSAGTALSVTPPAGAMPASPAAGAPQASPAAAPVPQPVPGAPAGQGPRPQLTEGQR